MGGMRRPMGGYGRLSNRKDVLGKKEGNTGVVKAIRGGMGKKDVGSVVHGNVHRATVRDGTPRSKNGGINKRSKYPGSRSSPSKSRVKLGFLPFRFPKGELCSVLHPLWPQASRKHR